MPNIVYIATSIDGFIADVDNRIEWLSNYPDVEGGDYGYSDFMNRIDCILMGRKTFETVIAFDQWPYDKKVFVLSTTITRLPAAFHGKAAVVNGSIQSIVNTLHAQGFHTLYIDGGETVQAFLKMDMIDELYISRVPLLLGGGIPLFSTLDKSLQFKHIKTEEYKSGIIKSHYIRER